MVINQRPQDRLNKLTAEITYIREHTLREAKQLADFLANWGSKHSDKMRQLLD